MVIVISSLSKTVQVLSARRGVYREGAQVISHKTGFVMHNAPRLVGYFMGNALFSYFLCWAVTQLELRLPL